MTCLVMVLIMNFLYQIFSIILLNEKNFSVGGEDEDEDIAFVETATDDHTYCKDPVLEKQVEYFY